MSYLKNKKIQLYLGSSSPRRRQLLTKVGLSYIVIKPKTEEIWNKSQSPSANVRRLSQEKATDVLSRLNSRALKSKLIILAADTTVLAPNGKTILQKPRNSREAIRMVGLLAGKTHTVLTGYSLLYKTTKLEKIKSRVVKTRVKFRKLSQDEIRRYVSCGESRDKAGAYAAQGFGMTLIEKINGSYTNVVGLPVSEVLGDIKKIAK